MSGRKKVSESGSVKSRNESDTGAAAQLSALTGGIAHDLNTVITTIYGYSEMALGSLESREETARNIRMIIGAADRAKILTGQLLDLSRRAAQEKVPVRVSTVLSDTIDFISPSVPDRIRIIRNITAPDAYVRAVPAQLFRIFMNLILNAIQAMSEKGGTLTVTLGYKACVQEPDPADPGRCLHVRISDTGKGMDEEVAASVFKPFVSVGKENGTGLGLIVVSDAVLELGGTITVTSVVNEGTTFDIIIPGLFFGPVPEKY